MSKNNAYFDLSFDTLFVPDKVNYLNLILDPNFQKLCDSMKSDALLVTNEYRQNNKCNFECHQEGFIYHFFLTSIITQEILIFILELLIEMFENKNTNRNNKTKIIHLNRKTLTRKNGSSVAFNNFNNHEISRKYTLNLSALNYIINTFSESTSNNNSNMYKKKCFIFILKHYLKYYFDLYNNIKNSEEIFKKFFGFNDSFFDHFNLEYLKLLLNYISKSDNYDIFIKTLISKKIFLKKKFNSTKRNWSNMFSLIDIFFKIITGKSSWW